MLKLFLIHVCLLSIILPSLASLEGECPDGWYLNGFICSKRMNGEYNFEEALNKCEDEEDKRADVDHYVENVANLLTLAKLRNFLGHPGNLTESFRNTIRLNAIKYNGAWWAIHHFKNFKIQDLHKYCHVLSGAAIKLGEADFALFPNFNLESGHDYSTLSYSPYHNNLQLESHKSNMKIVCTHKKEEKSGDICPGEVAECCDLGDCIYQQCYCYEGSVGQDCCLLDTTGAFSQGFGKLLIIGGGRGTIASGQVDLVDLETGEICAFTSTPTADGRYADGEALYVNGKAYVCSYERCATWDGSTWVEDSDLFDNVGISVSEENAVYTPDGKWFIVSYSDTAIYDPAMSTWTAGPTLDIELPYSACLTFIAKNKVALISTNDNNIYTLDWPLTSGKTKLIGPLGYDLDNEGSCQTLNYNGAPTVVIFNGNDGTPSTDVILWNTVTNKVTLGQNYPVDSDRDDAQSFVWNDDTIIFGGGENSDGALYKYTIDGGFEAFSTLAVDGSEREEFQFINVPADEFNCPTAV